MLNAADLIAHTGVLEGTPLCVLEAQACGKAVVAYRMAGVPEHVVDGVTGLLAPPLDVPGLAGRIRTLVGDSERRATMGSAARANVVARHRIEPQIERNAELLAAILGIRSRGAQQSADQDRAAGPGEVPAPVSAL